MKAFCEQIQLLRKEVERKEMRLKTFEYQTSSTRDDVVPVVKMKTAVSHNNSAPTQMCMSVMAKKIVRIKMIQSDPTILCSFMMVFS